jgi:L-alanine-DL-glutamate epimerase-like enolase superfamily enzyme
VRIERIEAFPFYYPVVGRFKFFERPDGSPIGRPTVAVKLTTDDGLTGWGQSVPIPSWSYETIESVTVAVRDYLAPALSGWDIFDLHGAHLQMNRCIAGSFSTGMPLAKAGIDLALHDVIGKALGSSLPALWGRSPVASIELSWTLNPRSQDEIEPLIEEGRRRGYRHFNVKVAPDLAFDLELCRRVRKAAPDSFLWADANGGYDLPSALRAAPAFADLGVDVLEQPLPANQLTGYRRLKRQGALPILMDEGVVSVSDLVEFIRLDLLDGVAMKPARCGGLFPARRQIEILEDAGLLFLGSGLTDPDLSLAASLILFGAFNYRRPAALNGPQFLSGTILKQSLETTNGCLEVPVGPGLGVEVEQSAVTAMIRSHEGAGNHSQ